MTNYNSQSAILKVKDFHYAGIPYGVERASVIGSTEVEDNCSIIDLNRAQKSFVDVFF